MARVAFLLNNEFLFDNRVYREAITLAQAGFEVTIFCVRDAERQLPTEETAQQVRIRRIFSKPLQTFKPFTSRHIRALASLLSGGYGRFDVVHAHDSNMLLLGWALARIWQAKLIYDSHELWESVFEFEKQQLASTPSPNARKMRQLTKTSQLQSWLMPRCDAMISVNDTLCGILAQTAKLRPDQCVSIRNVSNYFPTDGQCRRNFHEAFQLRPDQKVLLYQGDIKPTRGIEQLLDVMEINPNPDLVLVLMGLIPNPAFSRLLRERVSQSAHLQNRVFFKERLKRDELLCWTASADLGLAPILNSRISYYYCLPNKLFEYIQAELPCAVSDFPEMKRIVDGYGVGFTFNPADPQEMAQRIEAFFQHPEQAAHYRKQARLAKQELNWENEQQKLLALYEACGLRGASL